MNPFEGVSEKINDLGHFFLLVLETVIVDNILYFLTFAFPQL